MELLAAMIIWVLFCFIGIPVLLVVTFLWLRGLAADARRRREQPPPAVPVRPAPKPAPAPRPAAAPGYLPKWDGTRRWAAREDKAAWDGAFEALAGPPVPLPKPAPASTPDKAAVFARLRDRLDHL